MYVLAFGGKNGNFYEGGDPPRPPPKYVVSQKKKSKKFFALDPQFLFSNIKVLYKIGCLQKTRVQKIGNWPRWRFQNNIFSLNFFEKLAVAPELE